MRFQSGLPVPRIGCAAGAVAVQKLARPGLDLGIDLLLQLPEQPLLQTQVARETGDLVGLLGGEFRIQEFRVPGCAMPGPLPRTANKARP